MIITQVATCAVSRPREADCQDEQQDATRNIVRCTCMNDVRSSQFRSRTTSRTPQGGNSGYAHPLSCLCGDRGSKLG